jgi:hypothetical protein
MHTGWPSEALCICSAADLEDDVKTILTRLKINGYHEARCQLEDKVEEVLGFKI